jgi:hypothetical protein
MAASATLHTCGQPQAGSHNTARYNNTHALPNGTQTSPNTSNLNQMLKGWASEGWWPELEQVPHPHWPAPGWIPQPAHTTLMHCPVAGTQTSPNTSNLTAHARAGEGVAGA